MATKTIARKKGIRVIPVATYRNPLFEECLPSAFPGYSFNKCRRGDMGYELPVTDQYHRRLHNIKKLRTFISCRFFCDIARSVDSFTTWGSDYYSMYFIELRLSANADFKEDRVFINVDLFCNKIKLYKYMKQYWDKVSIVGDYLLIQVII